MSFSTIIAIYFVIWWIIFVAIINIGLKTQSEMNKIQKGTPLSAPIKINFKQKIINTSIITVIITGIIYWLIVYSNLSFNDYPFMPNFKNYK